MADGVASRFNIAYTAQAERQIAGVPLTPSGNLSARGGVRPGQTGIVTVGGSPEAWTVAAHSGVIEPPADTDGSWVYAIPAPVSEQLPARPAAGNTRKDIIVARALDVDVPATGAGAGVREVDVQRIGGTATSGTPSAPSTPAGAELLATLTVPATGSITIAPGRRTVANGAVLPIASSAERSAIARLWDGLLIYREDLGKWQGRRNGAWTTLPLTEAGTATATVAGGSGIATFTHGLGVTPSAVIPAIETAGGGARLMIVTARTSTTFSVQFKNATDAPVANGSVVTVGYIAQA